MNNYNDLQEKIRKKIKSYGIEVENPNKNHYAILRRTPVYDMCDLTIMRGVLNMLVHEYKIPSKNISPRNVRSIANRAKFIIAEKLYRRGLFIEY